jgi:carnosine N-methyltransferase
MSQQEHQHSHSHGHDHSQDQHDQHTHHHDHAMNEDEHEQFHLLKVISAFAYYKRHASTQNQRRRRDYSSLPEHHKKLIPNYLTKLNAVDDCIDENMKLIRDIVSSASMFLESGEPMTANKKTPIPSPMDMDKVKSTLKQFVRDWSKEVNDESTFVCIIKC